MNRPHSLPRRGRRVYLDLGANKFATSVTWFNRMYPLDFTEIHAFEVERDLFVVPQPLTPEEEKVPSAVNDSLSLGAEPQVMPMPGLQSLGTQKKGVSPSGAGPVACLNNAATLSFHLPFPSPRPSAVQRQAHIPPMIITCVGPIR